MNNNPYTAPTSSVEQPSTNEGFELHPPRAVGVGRGVAWIGEGFEHFKKDPGPWILICIVGLVIMIALSIIPIVSLVTSILYYVWIGGLLMGCRDQDKGESINISHLFAGFQVKAGPLILLGVILMVATLIIFLIAMGPWYWSAITGAMPEEEVASMIADDPLQTFVLPMLIALAFVLPVIMLGWFAPALIVLNDVPVMKAMGMSFMGCLKNVVPFLLYGIIMLILMIVTALPLFLGWLVFVPMTYGSIYRSYKDIYID